MVEVIRQHVGVDTLKFNTVEDVCEAIGMPKERIVSTPPPTVIKKTNY